MYKTSQKDAVNEGSKFDSAQSLLAAIVEFSEDAIVTKDLNGIITSWNQAATRIFGYSAAEVIGQPVSILIPADHANEEPQILERIRRGERLEHYETVRQRKNGARIEVSLTVSPLKDADGRIIGASKIARDITKQRRAQDRLRHSEERFRVTLASIGDAVVSTDKAGQVTFMNSVAEKLTGWTQQQAIGVPLDNLFKVINEITRQPVESPVTRVLQEGIVVGLANHTVLISKNGEELPIDDSAAPIRSPNGSLLGVVLVFRDVTQRRMAELTARKLAAIVQNSDDAIYTTHLNGAITSWNKGCERIFGYTAEEALGRTNISLILPEDRKSEDLEITERLQKGEHITHLETTRVARNGREIDVSLSVSLLKEPSSGRIIGVSKIARDITERKRRERNLAASAAQFRLAIEAAPNGMVMVDARGIIVMVNTQMERLFGYDRAQMLGQPIEMLLPERFRAGHPMLRQGFFAAPEARPMGQGRDLFARRKDGSEFPVEIGLNPANTAEGAFVLAAVIDITERKRLEQQAKDHARNLEATVAERTAKLQQTVADLEAFSFTISHDLRSPLRAMEGFAQAVLEEYGSKLDAQGREYLQRIRNSAMHLDKLILEVLTYSRVGRSEPLIQSIDLEQLLEEVIQTYPSIRKAGAEISIERPLHPVLGSHAALVQCISNLLDNAVKFVPAGAKAQVRLWTEKSDSKVRLSIQDKGIGIPENSFSRIFEPFQRAHPYAGYEGTGMGLAIVHKAVQKLGGTVGVRSQEGQGSTFWIELSAAFSQSPTG